MSPEFWSTATIPADYARVLATGRASPRALARMSAGAIRHASGFGWSAAVDRLLAVYTGAVSEASAGGMTAAAGGAS